MKVLVRYLKSENADYRVYVECTESDCIGLQGKAAIGELKTYRIKTHETRDPSGMLINNTRTVHPRHRQCLDIDDRIVQSV